MTEELAKQKVLAVYPDAWLGGLTFDPTKKVFSGPINKPRECKELGLGQTEEAAWQNAAESLPAAPEQKKCQLCNMVTCVCGVSKSVISFDFTKPGQMLAASGTIKALREAGYTVATVEAKEKERFPDNFSEAAAFAGITSSQGCQFHLYLQHLLGKDPKPGFLVAEPKPTPSTPAPDYSTCVLTGEEHNKLSAEFKDAGLCICGLSKNLAKDRLWLHHSSCSFHEPKPQPDSSSIPDEKSIDPALKLLADVMHLWIDGYISKSPNSAAPNATSQDKFDEIERFLAAHGISVDYCGWHVNEPRDSSSIPDEQTFEEWLAKNKLRLRNEHFEGDRSESMAHMFARAAWAAAKGQSNGR